MARVVVVVVEGAVVIAAEGAVVVLLTDIAQQERRLCFDFRLCHPLEAQLLL